MTKKTRNIDDLREALFTALDGLRDGTVTVEQARAISEMSQTIINSAKVEVDYLRTRQDNGASRFLGGDEQAALPAGVRVVQHRLKG